MYIYIYKYGKIKHVPNHQPDHSYIPKNCLSLARMAQALGLHELSYQYFP